MLPRRSIILCGPYYLSSKHTGTPIGWLSARLFITLCNQCPGKGVTCTEP
jgi:hypothetical protein